MRNIEEFMSDPDDFIDGDELEHAEERKVIVDYDDFVELAKENGALKNKLNYILRALRIGLEPPTISALFDDEEDFDANKFLEMNFFDIDHEGVEEKADE